MVTSYFKRMFKHFLLLFVHNGHPVSFFGIQLLYRAKEYGWSEDFIKELLDYGLKHDFIVMISIDTYHVYSLNEYNPIYPELIEWSKEFYSFKQYLDLVCSIRDLPWSRVELLNDELYDVAFVIDDHYHKASEKLHLLDVIVDKMLRYAVDNACTWIYDMSIIQLK